VRRKLASLPVLAVAALLGGCRSPEQPEAPAIDRLEISLVPTRESYPVGDTLRATFVAIGRDGLWMRTGLPVWRSLTPTIASVNAVGAIGALARGTAIIELEVDGTKGQIPVPIRGILHTQRLDANETWLVADTPHVVKGYFNVGKLGSLGSDTVVLTIEPGVTVRLRPRSGLEFGDIGPGALVIPPGGDPVVMEGDSAARGSWVGLSFKKGRAELRKLTIRHCGAPTPWDAGVVLPCLSAGAAEILIDDVTVRDARDAVRLARIAPGSRALSIHNATGYAATIAPSVAGNFPRGGTFSGNVENEIRITGGIVEQSAVWSEAGMPWRLSGPVEFSGSANPVLTIPASIVIRADVGASLSLGSGGLIAGATGGAPLVIESTGAGWGGIAIERAEGSALRNVTLRDCGGGGPGLADPCLSVEGAPEGDAGIILEDVTIRGARNAGIRLGDRGRFHATSRNIVIRETKGVPIELWPQSIPSIPAGEYGFNDVDAIRLRGAPALVWETATWRNVGVPYLAPDGIVVESSIVPPTLTIEPGVVVRLGLGTTFAVGIGRLQAVGTAASPIVFTSVTPGVAGSWMGIELANWDTPFLRLEHVEIADAGNGPSGFAGALRLNVDPGGVIRNSIIRRSPSCGVILLAGQWSSDYASPAFGNTFVNVAGPATCRASP
jgi:hypothetical protein